MKTLRWEDTWLGNRSRNIKKAIVAELSGEMRKGGEEAKEGQIMCCSWATVFMVLYVLTELGTTCETLRRQ